MILEFEKKEKGMTIKQEEIGENKMTKNIYCPVCRDTKVFVESESPVGFLICSCGYRQSASEKKLVFTNTGYKFE